MKQVQLTNIYRVHVSILSRRSRFGYVERKYFIVAHTEPQAREKMRVYMEENKLFPRTESYPNGIWSCHRVGGKSTKTLV